MQRLAVIGSTGSIGVQTLAAVDELVGEFEVVCLAHGGRDTHLFAQQCDKYQPVVKYTGDGDLSELADVDADIFVLAVVGRVGIELAYEILRRGKILCIATKEVLVCEGCKIIQFAAEHGGEIRPIDSEHSAIWQCLKGERQSEVAKIILTCSGGPFLDAKKWSRERLATVTRAEVLAHPKWQMGAKISVDSATLFNKALELIETCVLFDIAPERVEVVVHPEAIVHSAVEFIDGSVIAQLSPPDMRLAIATALTYPRRAALSFPKLDLFAQRQLTFLPVDSVRFPSLQLAVQALQQNKCTEFNDANELAVADFLAGKITYLQIFDRVRAVVEN